MRDKKPPTTKIEIEGKAFRAATGENLLDAIRKAGFEVPSLCHYPPLTPAGACRLCLVEVIQGNKTTITTSCNFPVQKGLTVRLDTERVRRLRKTVLRLLLAMAPQVKPLRDLAANCGVFDGEFDLQRAKQPERCIQCGLCVRVCKEIVGACALSFLGRGRRRSLSMRPLGEFPESCIGCGACENLCPTGAVFMEGHGVEALRRRPGLERPCRYSLMGLTPGAVCEKDYACATCEVDQMMLDRSMGHHPIFLARGLIPSEEP